MSEEIDKEIIDIIRSKVSIGKDGALSRDSLISDLGIESIDSVEIFFEIEDRLSIVVDIGDFPMDVQTTIGDLIDFVKSRI